MLNLSINEIETYIYISHNNGEFQRNFYKKLFLVRTFILDIPTDLRLQVENQ